MTGSLGEAGRETARGERRELINNSICCPAWGSISPVSDCQCVWGGEAGSAARTILVLTARRTINGHNLISHYHHQWLLACRTQHNSIRQAGVWGWGAPLQVQGHLGCAGSVGLWKLWRARAKTQLTIAECRSRGYGECKGISWHGSKSRTKKGTIIWLHVSKYTG